MRPARVIAMFVLALASCGKTEQPVFQGAQFNTDPPAPGPLNGLFVTTDNGSDRLSAVDPVTQKVRFTIPVGFIPVELEGPHHLVADPAGRFLYINLSEAVVGSGTGPHGAHGSGTIPGFVLKLSTKDGSQVGFAQVDPNPGDLTISPDGKTIYVTHYDLVKLGAAAAQGDLRKGDSNLVVIDAATMNVTRRVPLCPAAHGVRLTPDGKTLYSTCDTDEIAIVDLTAATLTAKRVLLPNLQESPSCQRCPYALTIAPDSTVWVSSLGPGAGLAGGAGGLDIYDPALNRFDEARSADFLGGRGLFAAFRGDPTSYEAYVPEQNPGAGDKIHVYTTTARTSRVEGNPVLLDPATCRNAHMISLSSDGNTGYLVCEGDHVGPGTFTFLDLGTATVGPSVQLGVFPDGLVLIPPG
ncbi:MAG: YncE family protein [Myxococcales bacterium]